MHVFDLSLAGADDRDIWQHAANTGAVIVTKDEFALRRTLEEAGPAVVWLRLGNTRKGALLRWLEPLPDILAALGEDEVLTEVTWRSGR